MNLTVLFYDIMFPKDASEVPVKDDSQPIYSNAMGEEERKAIPVVQFSEYMNRVKLGDYARLRQEYQVNHIYIYIY